MSLQIIAGGSGSGKSTFAYRSMIDSAIENPDRQYIIIVPDQFSMSTTREICRLHPAGGIMNIDVLSFSRLVHRISDEVGCKRRIILDDTGKNLILRRVGLSVEDELTFLKGKIKRPGYVHEVKSQLSEFYQYDITDEDMLSLMKASEGKGYLWQKLADLRLLYRAFSDYIKDKYITTEESLTDLARMIPSSGILAGSTVLFDDFTGFTPVQDRVIKELLKVCSKVTVTLCMEQKGDANLFALTKKTRDRLMSLADEAGVLAEETIYLPLDNPVRYSAGTALSFLEKNLLRSNGLVFDKEQHEVCISEATLMRQEVRDCCRKIKELIRSGCEYRQIAIQTGDMEGYGNLISYELTRSGIPFFMDIRKAASDNPAVTLLLCALRIVSEDFSYDSVMGYLKSGMAGVDADRTDRFDLYISALGIRGKSTYHKPFTKGRDAEQTADAEEIRIKLVEDLAPLTGCRACAKDYARALYEICMSLSLQEKCESKARELESKGMLTLAKEYEKIYGALMDLLDQVYALIGDDEIDIKEFLSVFEAGASEIRIGAIPQSVDQVVVGDMQRTRLDCVKYLFFLGVNEGIIPQIGSSGGLFSDMEREYLSGCGVALSPGRREKALEQRLYLYQNMTKPSDGLFISYSTLDGMGKSREPSFLIRHLMDLYPNLEISRAPEDALGRAAAIEDEGDGLDTFAMLLSGFMDADLSVSDEKAYEILLGLSMAYNGSSLMKDIIRSSIYKYEPEPLGKRTASLLYDKGGTISRLELMAACPFAHFVRYGLRLKEKQEYEFDSRDLGNVYHEALEKILSVLIGSELMLSDMDDETIREKVDETLSDIARDYGNEILLHTKRDEYRLQQMKRVLTKSLLVMKHHMKRGSFAVYGVEYDFTDTQGAQIRGKIDRIDIAKKDDRLYVKVVDYKSGERSFDISKLYYGVSIQLPIYLGEAVRMLEKRYPDKDVIPAAMLYYTLKDPVLKYESGTDTEGEMRKQMRSKGLFLDDGQVIAFLDEGFGESGSSDVVVAERKKDGSFSAASENASGDEMKAILEYAGKKFTGLTEDIRSGRIDIRPFEVQSVFDSCSYCEYRGICGFDERIPGYEKRKCGKVTLEQLFSEVSGDTKPGDDDSGNNEPV